MNIENQFIFFFSALGAFNGLVLSLYFAITAKRKGFSNYFLALLLLMLSIRIIKSVFFYFNPNLSNTFIQIGLSACILIGPFLFLYLKKQSSRDNANINWIIHIVPYLFSITILGFLYPYVENKHLWTKWVVKGIYIQWLIYIIFSLKFIQKILSKYKNAKQLSNIDLWLLSTYFGVVIIWFSYSISSYTSYIVGALSFSFVLYLIILLLVFNFNKASTFFQEKEKYRDKEIPKEHVTRIEQSLSILIEKEMFINPDISLEKMAKEIKVPKHSLSQYLNEKLHKSFSTYINELRTGKAKELLKKKKNYTIESIGYECGFNSKSAFFTSFKKQIGQTPSEYQKSNN